MMEPIGIATFVGDDDILYYDAESFLDCIREELPYRDTTGFRYEVLTDDPTVCKAADDILLDFFSEDDPWAGILLAGGGHWTVRISCPAP